MASRNGATRLIWGTLQVMLLFITAVKMLASLQSACSNIGCASYA